MTKCSRCGLESNLEQAFQRKRRFFGLRKAYYCPVCRDALHRKQLRRALIFYLATGVLGPLIMLFAPRSFLGLAITGMALAFALTIPVVVLHELGHLLVARWMGLRVFAIILGNGKVQWRRRMFGAVWEVRGLPFGGLVVLGNRNRKHLRLRRFLTVLAGPLTHVLWLAALLPLQQSGIPFGWPFFARMSVDFLIVLNAVTLISNLIPHKTLSALGTAGTDGAQLLAIPRLGKAEIDALLAVNYTLEAFERLELRDLPGAEGWVRRGLDEFPSDFNLLNMRAMLHMRRNENDRAREIFLGLLAREDLQPAVRAIMQNNTAYAGALIGEPAMLEEADRLSEQALQAMPWSPELRSTRGAVLIARGQTAEGLEMMRNAFSPEDQPIAQAEKACMIAIGEARIGQAERARAELELARRLDPDCPLLPRAAAEIGLAGQTIPAA